MLPKVSQIQQWICNGGLDLIALCRVWYMLGPFLTFYFLESLFVFQENRGLLGNSLVVTKALFGDEKGGDKSGEKMIFLNV